MCHSEMLALQFSLVLPGAVRPHEDVVVGLPTSQLGRCAFVTYKNKISDYYSGIIFQEPPWKWRIYVSNFTFAPGRNRFL